MLRKIQLTAFLIFNFSFFIYPQSPQVNKIEPPNWWSGMKHNKIQLMVYGENLSDLKAAFVSKKLKVDKVYKVENSSYAFIDVTISPKAKPGSYKLILNNGNGKTEINYELLERSKSKNIHQGFSNADVIYLLMPDRFANGDVSNDSVNGYYDSMQYVKNQNRLGGDIQGIINKLDYLKDFGVTAIWCTPLLENNTFRSYHGYAATDFYKVDPRLGSNELYKKFVDEAHSKGLKIIMDHVANHFSDDHPWIKNLPIKDWINGSVKNHLNANHNKMVFTDLYSDSSTIHHVEEGWFTNEMPDLNQENPFVANYIIQNTIWWIEYSGIDGIREDTYPYNDQKFMARWAKEVLNEYPTLNIVGEVWTGEPAFLAGYQGSSKLKRDFNTNLPALTDFGLRDIFVNYLEGKSGLFNIYNVLAKDYLYADPENLVTFVDNHDVARAMYFAKENIEKAKIAYTILLTTRGIPSIFYGSELGMSLTPDHGTLRAPFPGGFPSDERNAFTKEGRNDYENIFYNHLNKLLQIRKKYKALQKGKLIHFPPVDETYIYFREFENEKLLIIVNGNEDEKEIDLTSYSHLMKNKYLLKNVLNEYEFEISSKIQINKMSAVIFEIK